MMKKFLTAFFLALIIGTIPSLSSGQDPDPIAPDINVLGLGKLKSSQVILQSSPQEKLHVAQIYRSPKSNGQRQMVALFPRVWTKNAKDSLARLFFYSNRLKFDLVVVFGLDDFHSLDRRGQLRILPPLMDALFEVHKKREPSFLFTSHTMNDFLFPLLNAGEMSIIGWGVSNPDRVLIPPEGLRKIPPGIVFSKDSRPAPFEIGTFSLLRKDFPVTPVVISRMLDPELGSPLGNPETDAIMTYLQFADSLSKVSSLSPGEWFELSDQKRVLKTSATSSSIDARRYGWSPGRDFFESFQDSLEVDEFNTRPEQEISSFIASTSIDLLPELKFYVRPPAGKVLNVGEKGKVLAFCTWANTDEELLQSLHNPSYPIVKFADKYGLHILTWNTGGIYNDWDEELNKNVFDDFSIKWRAAFQKCTQRWNLSSERVLLFGLSRGAVFAHRIALRNPNMFLAVHTHIGFRYEGLQERSTNALWLVSTGEQDGGYLHSLRFFESLRLQGAPALFRGEPGLGHEINANIWRASSEFFLYALSLDEIMTSAPTTQSQQLLFKKFHDDANAQGWRVDYVNNDVYSADSVPNIVKEQAIGVPNEAILDVWRNPIKP